MGPTGALAVGGLRVADCTGTRRSTSASSLLLGLRPETADASAPGEGENRFADYPSPQDVGFQCLSLRRIVWCLLSRRGQVGSCDVAKPMAKTESRGLS
jgi:hypothetical protein